MNIDITKFERDENGNVLCIVMKNGDLKFMKGNRIRWGGCLVNFGTGKNNTAILYEGTRFAKSQICFGNNCLVSIGYSKYIISDLHILPRRGKNLNVIIGENLSCWGAVFKIGDDKNITIGDDCQFSYGIYLWNGDGHAIFDATTGECINQGKEVVIGNHVWIGHNVEILKGTKISDNSVVGAGSLVNKKFDEPNVILAGNPAKIIKTNINWDRRSPGGYMDMRSKL